MNRTTLTTVAAVATLAAAFFAGSSLARPERVMLAPANVATINTQQVFDALTERKDRLAQLQLEAGRIKADIATINQQINAAREAAAKLPEGPERETAMDAVIERDVRANIDAKKAEARLEKAQAATLKTIADKVAKQAALLSQKNGYTLVISSDDTMTISPRATSAEALQMLNLRRVFYVDPSLDITKAVIDALNAEYTATKPADGTPSPAAPGTNTRP